MGVAGSVAELWPSCTGDSALDRMEATGHHEIVQATCDHAKSSSSKSADTLTYVVCDKNHSGVVSDLSFLPWVESTPLHKPLYQSGGLVLVRGGENRNCRRINFSDAYELLPRTLGRGSYGEVMAAKHLRSGARRAVKSVMKSGPSNIQGHLSLVRREADILGKLDHPNVIKLYEVLDTSDKLHLVFEICDGGDFQQFLNRLQKPLMEEEAAAISWQMLSAMQHCHSRGVLHRDLKPEHFMWIRRMTATPHIPAVGFVIKLIDFGLSRRILFSSDTQLSPRIGTPKYSAPEVADGRQNSQLADRADVWSLGVIVHVLVLRDFPFSRSRGKLEVEEELNLNSAKASETCKDIIMKMLCRAPDERPNVGTLLRHAWFGEVDLAIRQVLQEIAPAVRIAVGTFVAAPRMRCLALVAVAWELDSRIAACVGAQSVYEALEVVCNGSMTRQALQNAAQIQGPLGLVAADLQRNFDSIDIDGSGAIEWTEFLAVMLSNGGLPGTSRVGGVAAEWQETPPVLFQDDVCYRAFDLLSQQENVITATTLDSFLNPTKNSPSTKSRRRRTPRVGPAVASFVAVPIGYAEFHKMIEEQSVTGSLDWPTFQYILQSGLEPPTSCSVPQDTMCSEDYMPGASQERR